MCVFPHCCLWRVYLWIHTRLSHVYVHVLVRFCKGSLSGWLNEGSLLDCMVVQKLSGLWLVKVNVMLNTQTHVDNNECHCLFCHDHHQHHHQPPSQACRHHRHSLHCRYFVCLLCFLSVVDALDIIVATTFLCMPFALLLCLLGYT